MAMSDNGKEAGAALSLDWCRQGSDRLRVLVLEPGPELHRALLHNLMQARYRVKSVESAAQIQELVERESPDMVIVTSGHEEMAARRRGRRSLPLALEPLILVIGQPEAPRQGTLQVDDLALDLGARQARHSQRSLRLSPKEFDLLTELMVHSGQVVARDVLIRRVWGESTDAASRTLDVHIRWLREKIETDPSKPERIQTIPGVGYRFVGAKPPAHGADPRQGAA
jgi:DNA-binding response OmpR family regulator